MAYPFAKAPAVGSLVDRAVNEYGCTLHTLENAAVGPKGTVSFEYLSRQVDGETLLSEPLPTNKTEPLSPDSARRLIKQLKLPPEAWDWAGNPYDIPDDDWTEHPEDCDGD